MKDKKIGIKTLIIIVLIGIIVALNSIILNIKNNNITKQEIAKEQLEDTTSDNAYVKMKSHLSEINEQEEKLVSFKTKIAEAITNQGIETNANDTVEIMSNNIANIVTEVTKNATAIEDDIVAGKTAWVNGKMITGSMTSNSELTTSTQLVRKDYNTKTIYKFTWTQEYADLYEYAYYKATNYQPASYTIINSDNNPVIATNLSATGTNISNDIIIRLNVGDTIEGYSWYVQVWGLN